MRWTFVIKAVGALVFCVGLTMVFPIFFSLYYHDAGLYPLIGSMALTLFFGAALFFLFKNPDPRAAMNHREGMAITAIGWAAAGIFGALPFYLADSFASPVDCVFESISGFTTTGASVMTDIEAAPKGILFWRSQTHLLGGMGIIVLSLAILPFLGVGGMQLYKAEAPGPSPDKLKPRIKDTASALWKVYLLITAILTVLLLFGGMDLFDALCHAFGTMATGGFSTRNASVAAFNSPYIDAVITVFMLVAGINFTLHYQLIKGRPLALWKDPECRTFLGIFAIVTAASFAYIYGRDYQGAGEAVQYASFQAASILTTTGFATADYELWPPLPQCLLILCMFIGGCAGSTAGGMKVMRLSILGKHCYRELVRLIHPRALTSVKFGGRVVTAEVMSSLWGFFILWLGLLLFSALIVAASGVDVVTSFASVLACIGNIGPGIGAVGPTENYAALPDLAKWTLTLCMLLGRLEIYTVIILFVPEFYRK